MGNGSSLSLALAEGTTGDVAAVLLPPAIFPLLNLLFVSVPCAAG